MNVNARLLYYSRITVKYDHVDTFTLKQLIISQNYKTNQTRE